MIIETIDLTYSYIGEEFDEHVDALSDVNLSIERGSFTAIIGRNGSGKSTLAKHFNCLLLPSGGKVYVDGIDTSNLDMIWEIRRRAGMVFQNPDNQLVSSVVEDDVAFGPENIGLPREQIIQRIDEALDAVGMQEHRRMAPHLLSGGQKQRVAIAGVLAMKPSVIVLDEPTAMLDPEGRDDVMEIIRTLHDEHITVVLITHFMEETLDCDKIYIMDQGKVAMEGNPKEIFSHKDEILELGLALPFGIALRHKLNELGMDVPKSVITTDEMVDYLIAI
jgi:energy-coupling factor transport system ATP-binding protein